MLKKIEDRTIMTGNEAAEKYDDCRFLFISTEQIGYDYENSKGYVAYTFNKFSESLLIPDEEIDCGVASYNTFGVNFDPEPYPSVGGVFYDD